MPAVQLRNRARGRTTTPFPIYTAHFTPKVGRNRSFYQRGSLYRLQTVQDFQKYVENVRMHMSFSRMIRVESIGAPIATIRYMCVAAGARYA